MEKEKDIINGKLKYEGEYLDGKWNGKGKEYNEHGKLNYEGGHLSGQEMEKVKNILLMVN